MAPFQQQHQAILCCNRYYGQGYKQEEYDVSFVLILTCFSRMGACAICINASNPAPYYPQGTLKRGVFQL